MKFTNTFDFLKTLVENDGVLYCENGNIVAVYKKGFSSFIAKEKDDIPSLDWFTEPPLQDKAPIMAWNDKMKAWRVYGFYDARNKCTFNPNGSRDGIAFENYEKLDTIPEWMVEAQKLLED